MENADLRAVELERDAAIHDFEETYADLAQARYELKQVRSDLVMEQAAFAAWQQDLSRMEAERDVAKALSEKLADQLLDVIGKISAAGADLLATRAELASARQELQQLRARQDDGERAARLILGALGIDPDEEQPLMAARAMRAELDEPRADVHHSTHSTPQEDSDHD